MTKGTADAVGDLLRAGLAQDGTSWSLGAFGAAAVFVRAPDEPAGVVTGGRLGLATARGALALSGPGSDLRPVAYETALGADWGHAVALCLPAPTCAMGGRARVTELGPDPEPARAADAEAVLFDLGLGLRAVDACLRTADPLALALLRAGVGHPLFAPGNPALTRLDDPRVHRVFLARIGRIEVYAPAPGPGAPLPRGPHAYIVPRVLRLGRSHAATAPIPEGFVPCATLHPPHPLKDGHGGAIPFARDRHEAFQALLDRWGDPVLRAVKRRAAEGGPSLARDRHERAAERVGRAQAACLARISPRSPVPADAGTPPPGPGLRE